jgi:mRNA-degrading endonuclease RelE of RelBE toxin-antitoxin system
MSFEVRTIPEFDQRAKALSKKYPSLKHDLRAFVELLAEEPRQGTPLGKGCYKVRMSIASKGRGKSGGARVITCVRIVDHEVWLLTIYDKSQQDSITDKELSALVEKLP